MCILSKWLWCFSGFYGFSHLGYESVDESFQSRVVEEEKKENVHVSKEKIQPNEFSLSPPPLLCYVMLQLMFVSRCHVRLNVRPCVLPYGYMWWARKTNSDRDKQSERKVVFLKYRWKVKLIFFVFVCKSNKYPPLDEKRTDALPTDLTSVHQLFILTSPNQTFEGSLASWTRQTV